MVNGELKEEFAVLDVQPLHPRRPDGEAAAVALLKQAAWQVQPIMKRRRWKVHVLRELEPENMTRGGDNTNRGEVVRIKVRRPGGGHYDFEHVLAVMLHELCHNEFGPHSASFYKLLDEITEECKQLQAKKQGGSGAGFDAQGQKLGHRGGWGVAPSDPKIAARDAAMKRAQAHAVMTGGGRVGGAVAPGLTPQQAVAAAALRRAKAEEFARANMLEDDAIGTLGDEPLRFGRPGCICGACSTDAQAGQCGAPAPGGAPKHRGVGTAEEPIVLD